MSGSAVVDLVLALVLLYVLFKMNQFVRWGGRLRDWIAAQHGRETPGEDDPPEQPGWP
jgi:hypothetical protein